MTKIYSFFQTEDWYEIPRNSIEFGKEIGRGAFGRVYVAKLSEIPGKYKNQKVAVKKLKSNKKFQVYLNFLKYFTSIFFS
jgi:hypothetical protein